MGDDIWKVFSQLFGANKQQQQMPDLTKISSVQNLLPESSGFNPGAVAAANEIGQAALPTPGYDPSWLDKMTGFTGKDGIQHNGWGGLALGAGQGILGGWMGMQQLNQAKEQLGESKRQFNKNYEANRSTTNTALEDRQRARVASNSSAYQSVNDYMKKNGV